MEFESVNNLRDKLVDVIINPILLLFMGVAVAVFLWGVIELIYGLQKGEDTKDGKMHLLWGLVGMFVMVAAYAIVQLIGNTVGSPVPLR